MFEFCTADIPYDLDEIEIEQLRAAPASEVQQGPPNLLTGLVPGMSGGVSGGGMMMPGAAILLLASTGKQSGSTPRGGGGGGGGGGGRGATDDAAEGANGSPGESSGGEVRLVGALWFTEFCVPCEFTLLVVLYS